MAKRNSRKKIEKAAANHPKLFIAAAIILLILVIAVVVVWFVYPKPFHKYLGLKAHDWSEWTVSKEADCGNDGKRKRVCSMCDEMEEVIISATGEHIWSEYKVTKEADCGYDGKRERVCSVCEEKEEEIISATGEHEWSEYTVTKEADCSNDGTKKRECFICEKKEEEIISATGEHIWSEYKVTKEAICGNNGTKERVCSVCEEKEEEIIYAASEHSWSEYRVTKEADCGNDGKRERVCSVCGEKEEESIPATNNHIYDGDVCTVCGYDNGVASPASVAKSTLSIHFLELGNKYTGDCTLIKCGDTEILIDAGSRKDSAATIKSYVDQYCTDGVLEYVIATHAHQDHIAGFVGNSQSGGRTGILYQYKIGTLIQFARHNTNSDIYNDYVSAVEYAKGKGTIVYTAKECWYETNDAKKQYFLDESQTVSMNILYNYYYDNKASNENNYSVCMLLTHVTTNKTYNYLFTGDLEKEGESYLVERNELPEVDLFKGGHHGSYTASTEKLLSVIKPKNVAVCCCCGTTEYTTNNDNTFPSQAFIDRVSKYTENIYCTTLILDYKKGEYTSMNGNIVFYFSNGSLKLYCTNNTTILKDTEWFKENRTWSN